MPLKPGSPTTKLTPDPKLNTPTKSYQNANGNIYSAGITNNSTKYAFGDKRPANPTASGVSKTNEVNANAQVWNWQSPKLDKSIAQTGGTLGNPKGPVSGDWKLTGGQITGQASGQANIDLKHGAVNAQVGASGGAYLVRGEINGQANIAPGVSAEGHANGFVGAEANVNAQAAVHIDPTNLAKSDAYVGAHADTFVGAKASANVQLNAGPASVNAGGSAQAGFGAEFNIGAGFKDGKLQWNLGGGGAIGVGLEGHVSGSIDVGQAAHDVQQLASNPVVQNAEKSAAQAVQNVGHWLFG